MTTRFGCSGELQWLLVAPEYRGSGAAPLLLTRLADWFLERQAQQVCVNVETENLRARRFYSRHGAEVLSEGWMVWSDIALTVRRT